MIKASVKKYANCGLCNLFTLMANHDAELGFVCDNCFNDVTWTDTMLRRWPGVRQPRRGDLMPPEELL